MSAVKAIQPVPARQDQQATIDTSTILALANQDLGKLSPEKQAQLLRQICTDAGIPVSLMPIQLLRTRNRDGSERTVPYVTAAGAHYLAHRHNVSTRILERETVSGIHLVRAEASTPDGRATQATGAVPIDGLRGEMLANAFMKAETKAVRRAVLRLCGLAFLDETETSSIPDASPVTVSYEEPAVEGEVIEGASRPAEQPAPAAQQSTASAMKALHAAAKGIATHTQLSDLAKYVFGASSMRALETEQLQALREAVEECSTAETFNELLSFAGAIDSAIDAEQLAAAGVEISKSGLRGNRRELLAIAFKRVQQEIAALTAKAEPQPLDLPVTETEPQDALASWMALWRYSGELYGVRSIDDAARFLGVPRSEIQHLTPEQLRQRLDAKANGEEVV